MLTRRRVANQFSENDPAESLLPVTKRTERESKISSGNLGSSISNGSFNIQQSLNRVSSSSDLSQKGHDRTQEFFSVIKSAQARRNNFPLFTNQGDKSVRTSEFQLISKKIGKDISSTNDKLQKLTILVEKRFSSDYGIQDDIPPLINFIKLDLTNLNKQIAQLQQLLKNQRVQKDGRHKLAHSNSVIVALQSKLAMLSTQFKLVLEVRNENLRQADDRQLPSNYHHSKSAEVGLREGQPGFDMIINMDGGDTSRNSHQQRQNQMVRQKVHLDDRNDAMTDIEQTIVELGGIFQQLATMVKEQEEIVQRIDSYTDETQLNIDVAHGEIVKYFHNVSSSRSLMIKIFIVLIVLFIVLVVILT